MATLPRKGRQAPCVLRPVATPEILPPKNTSKFWATKQSQNLKRSRCWRAVIQRPKRGEKNRFRRFGHGAFGQLPKATWQVLSGTQGPFKRKMKEALRFCEGPFVNIKSHEVLAAVLFSRVIAMLPSLDFYATPPCRPEGGTRNAAGTPCNSAVPWSQKIPGDRGRRCTNHVVNCTSFPAREQPEGRNPKTKIQRGTLFRGSNPASVVYIWVMNQ